MTVISEGTMLARLSQRVDMSIYGNGGVLASILTDDNARLAWR